MSLKNNRESFAIILDNVWVRLGVFENFIAEAVLHEIHEGKSPTSGVAVRDFNAKAVSILMGMHLGAPSTPCVQPGDHVKLGQVIGEPVGFLGLPVHASVSGEVLEVGPVQSVNNPAAMAVTIKNDFKDEWVELHPLGDVERCPVDAIVPAIKAAAFGTGW